MSSDFEVNTNEYLSQCDSKDVISLLNSEKWIGIKKLKDIINQAFTSRGSNSIADYISNNYGFKNSHCWFNQGEDCEILRVGSLGWQKGKIKINVTLEFIPNEPEEINSPLDDVRQQINQSDS